MSTDSTTPAITDSTDQEFTWSDADSAAIETEPTYTQGEVNALVNEYNQRMRDMRTEAQTQREQAQHQLAELDASHAARIARLMNVAGRRADENSLCHVFEQTLIECGEPFDGFFDRVTIDLTFTVTVTQDVIADRRARRHDLDYMQRGDVQSTYYATYLARQAFDSISGQYGYAPILDSSDYAPVNHVYPKVVNVSEVNIDVISTEAINGHEAGDSRYRDLDDTNDDTDNDEDY